MVRFLAEKGITAGYVTVSQDYKTHDLKTQRIYQREAKADVGNRQITMPIIDLHD
jgi:glutaredoxin